MSLLSKLPATVTLRDASSTCTTPFSYSGAMRTAVCMRDVVAPPIIKGIVIFLRFISLATWTISSRDGVINPLKPIIDTPFSMATCKILSAGTITPISITSYPLQPRTTPTIFFPMSCTSPFTVAIKIFAGPAPSSFTVPASIWERRLSSFSASIKGKSQATLFFITRALFTTCGKNILPLPKRSPTTFIPSIRGPSITSRGFGYCRRASSVSASI